MKTAAERHEPEVYYASAYAWACCSCGWVSAGWANTRAASKAWADHIRAERKAGR